MEVFPQLSNQGGSNLLLALCLAHNRNFGHEQRKHNYPCLPRTPADLRRATISGEQQKLAFPECLDRPMSKGRLRLVPWGHFQRLPEKEFQRPLRRRFGTSQAAVPPALGTHAGHTPQFQRDHIQFREFFLNIILRRAPRLTLRVAPSWSADAGSPRHPSAFAICAPWVSTGGFSMLEWPSWFPSCWWP